MTADINQIDLIAAIGKHLERRHHITTVIPRHINAIIAAANLIVEEFGRPVVDAQPNSGLQAWLCSDDTGASSLFMAHILGGAPPLDRWDFGAYPRDPDDFGRCVRLLDAVPEFRPRISEMAKHGKEWAGLVGAWDEIEALYRKELPTGRAPKTYAKMKQVMYT